MEQIIQPNQAIVSILGKAKAPTANCRWLHYCVSTPVDEGVLVFNMLTRELLLLTAAEYENAVDLPYLRDHWFIVPEETEEKKLVDMVRWIQRSMRREPKHITGYTILTTTDCNARCFYCYELGRSRIPMSEETAKKTALFIKDHCGGKEVRIGWFGGEPLYNHRAIDIICDTLRAEGVVFRSKMISNGYLFDDEMVEKAASSWNLDRVQITLDGTEAVYNRCKAFIYKEGSAYQVVTANIDRLLDRGIGVAVRMNMDFHNAEDLMALSEELARRFGGKKLTAYPHLIFDDKVPWDTHHSVEKWTQLYASMHRLEDRLEELGLHSSGNFGLSPNLPEGYCMADDPSALVVTPDGRLGVCEHYSETELIGNLDSDARDQAVIESFRQRCDEIPECPTCFYYPQCTALKKCPDRIPCIPPERESLLRLTRRAMINEYRRKKFGLPRTDSEPYHQE